MVHAHREPAPLPALHQTDAAGRPLPWPTFEVAPQVASPPLEGTKGNRGRARRMAQWEAAVRGTPSSALKGLVLALFVAGAVYGLIPAHAWWLNGPRWLLGLLALGAVGLLLGFDSAMALVLLIALAQAAPEIAAHPLAALIMASVVVALRIGWDWLPARRSGYHRQ